MKDDASKEQIDEFLKIVRSFASVSNGIIFPNRKKNMNSLSKYGISLIEQRQIIYNLTGSDYYSGPDEENNKKYPPGDIWVFKKIIRKAIFYIKLKLQKEGRKLILKCLSFHEDEL